MKVKELIKVLEKFPDSDIEAVMFTETVFIVTSVIYAFHDGEKMILEVREE